MKKPNFFIVGAPKSGTTSLTNYLQQHPEVFLPPKIEPHFFGSDLCRQREKISLSKYLSLFNSVENEKMIGDASVYYLVSKNAPVEIKEFSPNAKIIIMLRNPIELIVSLFFHNRFLMFEDQNNLGDALKLEKSREEGKNIPKTVDIVENLLYRKITRFSDHVKRYWEVFGKENVKIIIFNDFKNDTSEIFQDVCKFLNIDFSFKPNFQNVNPAYQYRSKFIQRILTGQIYPSFFKTIVPTRKLRHILSKLNTTHLNNKDIPRQTKLYLRDELIPEIKKLSMVLNRNLEYWYDW